MPFVLIPIIGAQAIVPALAVSALFNNGGQLLAFRDHVDWRRAILISVAAVPFCLLRAALYTQLRGRGVLLAIGGG